jgi:hypothetical protein
MGGGLMNQDWFWTELSPDGDGNGRSMMADLPLAPSPKPEGTVLLD